MDPNNPFTGGLGETPTRTAPSGWQGGGVHRLAVPRFYAWATVLVRSRRGASVFRLSRASHHERSGPARRPWVRALALAGYQVVLDEFTDALSYTADTDAYLLAPLALGDMLDLGAVPEGCGPR